MQPAQAPLSARWDAPSGRRRLASFVAAVTVHLLLLLLLLRLAPPAERRPPPGGSTATFDLPQPTAEKQAAKHRQQRRPQAAHAARAAPRPPAAQPTHAPTPADTAAKPWVLNPEIAGFNLGNVPSRPAEQVAAGGGAAGAEAGSDAGSGKSVGRGPGGVQLYAAEWVREPTDAEMGPYMPHGRFDGAWAEIACRTVPRFHVEDCEELGQSPAGSGLSRALREAAFQFLVRPPRVNGRAMVGEWVRIHFDWTNRPRE